MELKTELKPHIKMEEFLERQKKEEKIYGKIYSRDNELRMKEKDFNVNSNTSDHKYVFNNDFRKFIRERLSEISADMYKMHSDLEGQINEIEFEGKLPKEQKVNIEKQVKKGFIKGNKSTIANYIPYPQSKDIFTTDEENKSIGIYNYSPSKFDRIPLLNDEQNKNIGQIYNQLNLKKPKNVSNHSKFFHFNYHSFQNPINNPQYLRKRNSNVEANYLDKRDAFTKLDKYDSPIKQTHFGNIESIFPNIENINKFNSNRQTAMNKYEFQKKSKNDNYVNLNQERIPQVNAVNLNTIQN